MKIINNLKKSQILRKLFGPIYLHIKNRFTNFNDSSTYWDERYQRGGNSGAGSYDKFATFKAETINKFLNDHNVKTAIEFGCGDGNQLSLINYRYYTGFDVSETIIKKCREKFSHDKTKSFYQLQAYNGQSADLTLSLDVIYHLVEDTVYRKHLNQLFSASKNFVIIYSSNTNDQQINQSKHVRHRQFLADIDNNQWELLTIIPNKFPYDGNEMKGSPADFFIFKKKANCNDA